MTTFAEAPVAEQLQTSHEVYAAVMADALPLSVLARHSDLDPERRNCLYGELGIQRVQLEPSRLDVGGHRLLLSDQTTQPGFSYKGRGMANVVFSADEAVHTFHIASAGNAANGLADVARRRGKKTIMHCIQGASSLKVGNAEANGAEVLRGDGRLEDRMLAAETAGLEPGHASVHPFDQVEVISGHMTVGWETIDDLLAQQQRGEIDLHKDPVKLLVPVGGGGLVTAVACVVKWAKDQGLVGKDNVQVIGVQMEGCDAMKRHVDYSRAGVTPPDALFEIGMGAPFNGKSDGTAVRKPGELTSKVVADPDYVAEVMRVGEADVAQAMKNLTERHHKRIEPAGALSMAGAQMYAETHRVDVDQRAETLITFTTGASVDDKLYESFMSTLQTREEQRKRQRYVNAMYALATKKHVRRPASTQERTRGTKTWSGRMIGARAIKGATS